MVLGTGPGWAQSSAPTTIRVGIYQNEPKLYMDEHGQPQGIFPDLLQAMAEQESWRLIFIPGTWQENMDRLRRAEIDLMPDVCFTEERAEEFVFNRIAVISDWFGVFTRRDSSIRSLPDLSNCRVAVLSGSIQETLFASMVKGFDLGVELVPAPDYDSAAKAVRDGQAEAMICNRYAGPHLKKKYDLGDTAIIFNPTILNFAAPNPELRPLLDVMDRYLETWKADLGSVYYTILKKHAGEAPAPFVPHWLRIAAVSLAGALLIAAMVALLLRREVARRTVELRNRTRELEEALQSLHEAQAMALQQERLHVLGQMASGVAHDFNNVLMPIIGFAELLLDQPEDPNDPERLQEYLRLIAKAGQDGQLIVARLRGFYQTRGEIPAWTQLHPDQIMQQVKDLTQPRWHNMAQNDNITIKVQTDIQETPPILANATEVREALVNLVFNAVDAMPQGGTLTLAVTSDPDTVHLTVKDQGIGMPEDVQVRCFNAFFTTKGPSGTGMGLPMVKQICDKYAGCIRMTSRPGSGTSFTISFPAIRTPGPSPVSAGQPEGGIRPLRILIVDDEPSAVDVLATILSAEGHLADGADGPFQAMLKIREHHYDLVLTDQVMPGLAGTQLRRRIMKQAPGLPVMILTDVRQDEWKRQYPSEPDCPFLEKPLRRQAFSRILQEMGLVQEPITI